MNRESIDQAIAQARQWLPTQGPIEVFVHHNTLHKFEHLSFEDAVEKVGAVKATNPYMAHDAYLGHFRRGRITSSDLEEALTAEQKRTPAKHRMPATCGGESFYRAALLTPQTRETAASLRFMEEEKQLIHRFYEFVDAKARMSFIAETRQQVSQAVASHNYEKLFSYLTAKSDKADQEQTLASTYGIRHSQEILPCFDRNPTAFSLRILWNHLQSRFRQFTAINDTQRRQDDSDTAEINGILIRLLGSYLDQGTASWPMPERKQGFLASFLDLALNGERFVPDFAKWFPRGWDIKTYKDMDKNDITVAIFKHLGIAQEQWGEAVRKELLALSGWAGTIGVFESDPTLLADSVAAPTLADYLAVRMILKKGLREQKFGRATNVARTPTASDLSGKMLECFYLCQLLGVTGMQLADTSSEDFEAFLHETIRFSDVQRRRVWHLAYEQHLYHDILGGLAAARTQVSPSLDPHITPSFQAAFCIDDREESLRRHLEEVDPQCATYGVAGFFNIDMVFHPVGDQKGFPLCPAMVVPNHHIMEETEVLPKSRLQPARRAIHMGSHHVVGGHLLSVLGGYLAALPMATRILAPGVTKKGLQWTRKLLKGSTPTTLVIESQDSSGTNFKIGYTRTEMADRVEGILRAIGLIEGFAPLVFIIGHGSDSVNNPHKSAYDCGACSGRKGAPNARVFAQMANRKDIRALLANRGIQIPSTTHFVGGYHDTCSDDIDLFDTDTVPQHLLSDFAKAQDTFARATERDAHERCRRFEDAQHLPLRKAKAHVESRAHNLREARPECGHATNASCIVGRRALTRGLFLDRRAFLVSYDPTQDVTGDILLKMLSAVVPVCAGINLEYYFSYVDNDHYGAGTKLPHNLTGLIGVMDGNSSDLKLGLPWQMVEIHEPVRLLFVVEASQNVMNRILDASDVIARHVRNHWVRLVLVDPDSGAQSIYERDGFVPYEPRSLDLPKASASLDYYQGSMENLAPAITGQGAASHA